jgi:hypothetical protein
MRQVDAGKVAVAVVALPVLALAAVSLRYLLPHPPEAPLNVMRNPFAAPWLPIHATLSAVALLFGLVQLWNPANPKPGWHRWRGRVYVACCLLSAPARLVLAFGATTGPISTAGFGSLAVIWFAVTALGYRAALERRLKAHRAWMIRSYALTFGAVTLRVYLAVALALHLDFDAAYRAISFLAWVPNLILAEVLLRRGPVRTALRRL